MREPGWNWGLHLISGTFLVSRVVWDGMDGPLFLVDCKRGRGGGEWSYVCRCGFCSAFLASGFFLISLFLEE
jgi:hypothetical protein